MIDGATERSMPGTLLDLCLGGHDSVEANPDVGVNPGSTPHGNLAGQPKRDLAKSAFKKNV